MLDIAVISLLVSSNRFVDTENVHYILFTPVIAYVLVLLLWLILLLFKRLRRFDVGVQVVLGNVIWLGFVFYGVLSCARGLGIVHVCQFRNFNVQGKWYFLIMEESGGDLRPGNSFFIMDADCFRGRHNSIEMEHDGPYIASGTYEAANDTLVLLHSPNHEMRIVRHAGSTFTYYIDGKRRTDTLASNYLCGFSPSSRDSLWLGGGCSYLQVFRTALRSNSSQ